MNPPLTYRPKSPGTNIGGYRYFFNGQEGDNEVFGEVANFGYEFRQYDSRLARWWSVDPKWNEYSGVSPFVFCNGSPVMLMDPNGEKIYIFYGNKNKYVKYTPGMKIKKRYDSFVKDVINGLNYLYNHPEGEKNRVEYLVKSDIVLGIYQQTAIGQPSKYSGEKRELKWDNKHIDIFEEGSHSPIIGLAHEIDHAARSFNAWENLYKCEESYVFNGSNCDQYVDQAYSRDTDAAENSAIEYENFIGRQHYNGKRVSSYQRNEYKAPIRQTEAETIFSIEE